MIKKKYGGTKLIKYEESEDEGNRPMDVQNVEDEYIISYNLTREQTMNLNKENKLLTCGGCKSQISIFKTSTKCVDFIKALNEVDVI
jgi:hypothetical protein